MPGEVLEITPTREPVLERREGWGMASESLARVLYPESTADVVAAMRLARERGWKVHTWGNGRSYGDAALNEGHLLLDFSRMADILSLDTEAGVVEAQPGLTLARLWRHILPKRFWPPVVSGTMFTTLGGCAAANVHGKNNFLHGPIGEHILAFTLVTAEGKVHEVTRESDPELFHAAIGGFGMLGVFTSITLRLKPLSSGRLEVHAFSCADLDEMFDGFERSLAGKMDYVVGWIDGFPGGARLGRGQIHAARYLHEGEDPDAAEYFDLAQQELPGTFFGVIPKAWLWRFAKPFANPLGWRLVCWARYLWGSLPHNQHSFLQPHAAFNFLLDYMPDWKFVYKPGGLIQYQFFLPHERARDVFTRALEIAQADGLAPWLVVMKRHRPDPFLLSHALDGYSFACDFPVTDRNRGRLLRLTRSFNRMVVEAGGRFYMAKDSVVDAESVRTSLGDHLLAHFFALKRKLDPTDLLGGNLFRRVFEPARDAIPDLQGKAAEPLPEELLTLRALRDPAARTPMQDAGNA